MFNYAQLNEQGYCIGISFLSGEVTSNDMILIEENGDYIGRKYDRETETWTEEYLPKPEPVQTVTLEDVKKDIQPISETTQMTTEDTLTIIEYLMMLEEKIDALSVK